MLVNISYPFNIGEDISYCKGWKKGENTYDGKNGI